MIVLPETKLNDIYDVTATYRTINNFLYECVYEYRVPMNGIFVCYQKERTPGLTPAAPPRPTEMTGSLWVELDLLASPMSDWHFTKRYVAA